MRLIPKLFAAATFALVLLAPGAQPAAAQLRQARLTGGHISAQWARGDFRAGDGELLGDKFGLRFTNLDGSRMAPASKCAVVGCAPGETALPASFVRPVNSASLGSFSLRPARLLYSPIITGGEFAVVAPPVALPAELLPKVELTVPFFAAGRLWVEGRTSPDAPPETPFNGLVYGRGTLTMTFERGGELYFLRHYRFNFGPPQPRKRARDTGRAAP